MPKTVPNGENFVGWRKKQQKETFRRSRKRNRQKNVKGKRSGTAKNAMAFCSLVVANKSALFYSGFAWHEKKKKPGIFYFLHHSHKKRETVSLREGKRERKSLSFFVFSAAFSSPSRPFSKSWWVSILRSPPHHKNLPAVIPTHIIADFSAHGFKLGSNHGRQKLNLEESYPLFGPISIDS